MASAKAAATKMVAKQKDERENVAKAKQNELRKLMREKQTNANKIDSPLAKFNSAGQLVCVLCNVKIKTELVWIAHINGKVHRDNLLKVKEKKQENETKTSSVANLPVKRSASTENESPPEKKLRSSSDSSQKQLRVSFSLSDDEELEENGGTKSAEKNELPSDFFDAETKPTSTQNEPSIEASPAAVKQGKSALPEGFFDDPIMDAKIRKVEYKDPMDDEWEKFQKAMSEATSVSQTIMEVNDEEMKTDREIDEIDEQM